MTIFIERVRAIEYAREFLRDLLDPKKTPKVPREIRRQARYKLKHYPSNYEIKVIDETGNFKLVSKSLEQSE